MYSLVDRNYELVFETSPSDDESGVNRDFVFTGGLGYNDVRSYMLNTF